MYANTHLHSHSVDLGYIKHMFIIDPCYLPIDYKGVHINAVIQPVRTNSFGKRKASVHMQSNVTTPNDDHKHHSNCVTFCEDD